MSISILINNYNYAQYLGQAIESALTQTYSDVKVVVVDDGSTDESGSVIRSYGDRICAVFKANGGQASAINVGFVHCPGDIIMLLDSDDYLHPEAAAKIAAVWKPDTGALHHRLRTVDGAGKELGYLPTKPGMLDSGDIVPLLHRQGGRYTWISTSGRAYSREVLAAALPIPEEFRICADNYLAMVIPYLTPIAVLDEPVAYYRIHSSNSYVTATQRRRDLTRAQMLVRLFYRDLTWKVALNKATERNLGVPPSTLFRSSNELFDHLLIAVSGPARIGLKARIKHTWDVLRSLSAERFGSLAVKIRMTTLSLVVCLAPRPVLVFLYPGLFKT